MTANGELRVEVRRFTPKARQDFFALHGLEGTPAECFCAFWWLPLEVDWGKRTAEENRREREGLLERGEYDGYLAYIDGKVAGWCQVGPRDRLPRLAKRLKLSPDPSVWAISCFFVDPRHRKQGVAEALLKVVLMDLLKNGVKQVEAYPRRGNDLDDEALWNGPEQIFVRSGFSVVKEDAERPVLARSL